MKKFFNIIFSLLILIFFFSTFKYYSSKNNFEVRNYNRNNINDIINTKITNLPILGNDTDNVIQFNDGFSNEIKKEKKRSFWNLLKFE